MVDFIIKCRCENGGFAAHPNHDPHILSTLYAIQVLFLEDSLDVLDRCSVINYIVSLQQSGGEVWGDEYGEVDTRFIYAAVQALSILGALDQFNVEKAIEFIKDCQNFDGGFGHVPGAESHSAQIFTCVATLSILDRLDLINSDLLCGWLCERQLPSGGLNGRPEKLPDVCYSWWVLSSLAILGRLEWIDGHKLREFILDAQDSETGGIADRKGDIADVFHTVFGLAGLSLLNYDSLQPIDPTYCLPAKLTAKIKPWKS